MPSSDLTISGLQIGQPDDWSVKRAGEPLTALVELAGALGCDVNLRLTISDLRGRPVFDFCGPVPAVAERSDGCCHASLTIPAHALRPGRLSMSVEVPGGDQHRHRHMIEILAAPRGGPDGADSADSADSADGVDSAGGADCADKLDVGPWAVLPGPLPRAPHLRRVEQVRFQLQDRSEPLFIPGDVPLRVLARLWLDELEVDPLLRIQIFSQGGELVVGTNNERWDLSLGATGTRTVCVDFERLNLAPGHYFTTVGLWPGESSGEPIEARHGYYELLIDPGAPG